MVLGVCLLAALTVWMFPAGCGRTRAPLTEGVELCYRLSGAPADVAAVSEQEKAEQREKLIRRTENALDIVRRRLEAAGDLPVIVLMGDPGEILIRTAALSKIGQQWVDNLVTQLGVLEFRIVLSPKEYEAMSQQERRRTDVQIMRAKLHTEGGEEPRYESLYVQRNDDYHLGGKHLKRVFASQDEFGGPAVGFELTDEGAEVFSGMTTMQSAKEGRIAIILNGTVTSAPVVRTKIGSRGIITGDFTSRDVEDLVAVLQAGELGESLVFVARRRFDLKETP
ncbi:MAG TPA: hypothetical protein VMY39_10840 [Planctomycetota bacterium]|nr:hypothetical protein [Planctomycetota bacterium]